MHLPNEFHSLPWPISSAAVEFARRASQPLCPDAIANQIFDHAIAVAVVHNFLGILGISSRYLDPARCHSVAQIGRDISNLFIEDLGRLECYAIEPEVEHWPVRTDPVGDRMGVVFVSLNLEARQSVIQGFLPSLEASTTSLSSLQSVEYLLQHLHSLMTPFISITRWLSGVFEHEWQPFETVFDAPPPFSFRAIEMRPPPDGSPQFESVCRAKKLTWLVHDINGEISPAVTPDPVVMVMTATQLAQLSIRMSVRIYPACREALLPILLDFTILDDFDHRVMGTTARAIDNYLELQFKGVPGETFQVRVRLGHYWIVEKFQL